MLLQSHAGEIHLLPALPKAWADGSFRGLRARGGVEIDLEWRGGRATAATMKATVAGEHRLRVPGGQSIATMTMGGRYAPFRIEKDVAVFNTEPGRKYEVKFK
jgi:alpha-L-fucosidase 2